MSLLIFSDENVTDDKSAENCNFLFSPPELSRRSPVLRLSQKENVPPKNIARAMKVTFQTPLRDPQTHKILSPSMSSKLEACFALGDTNGLENSPRIWTQKENQQFTQEVDTKATDGILQKPAVADTHAPPELVRPASDDGPTSTPQGCLDPSSCPQTPASLKNQLASPHGMSDGPGQGLQENPSSYSLEKTTTSTSEVLDPPRITSPDRTEDPHRASGESSNRPPASSAGATSPPGTCPTVALREDPLADLPGALASPEDTSGPENTAPAGPLKAGGATAPSPWKEETSCQTANSSRNGPIRLEFDFSDVAASKKPPPPRKLGKRPQVRQEKAPKEAEEGSVPPTRGSYDLDWDKLDDPNFNPFGGSGEACSPECPQSRPAGPGAAGDSSPSKQVPPASADGTPVLQTTAGALGPVGQEGTVTSSEPGAPPSSLGNEPTTSPADPAHPAVQGPESTSDLSEELFRDPAEVLGTVADVDYLEQFGTSQFKESALRKQSLYLKFDPLLKDSPERLAPVAPKTSSAQDIDVPSLGGPPEATLVDLDFLGTPDLPVPDPPPCVLGPGGLIVDVLQYSQKDLDAAVEAAQKEVLQLRSRCEELHQKNLEMGKVMDGYESFMYQAMEEAQKQQDLAKAEIQKVLKEKEQLTADLNSMEKSFSDLFKRFEKQREAIEGYRTNEESLKKCVEGYIVRIQKEGQRYQALKAHAEEKLQLANEEIAQVRSKAQAEAMAFQASLRKEQMRVHSLEKTVEQKTKENDELTRICDDLISKMEKI
ncbi:PREDICTED: transforming acidic coiled-coil-containing protein 3 [Miniopterus natalensis]|uniref:transforming acidic coiled-coil-containing protein 3 n=1 Tax=Miniopterus natalensis TaxID=291302 RepID=UPI0007A70EF1|nr:PREDICTED: transforming acidic coiled-coil-containing protein 3 [Miniopterus natalensis]